MCSGFRKKKFGNKIPFIQKMLCSKNVVSESLKNHRNWSNQDLINLWYGSLVKYVDISKQIFKGELHTYFRCHGPSNSFYSKYLKSLYWVIEPLHQYNSVPFMTNPFSPCKKRNWMFSSLGTYTVVSVTLSGILKAKQKLEVTFNFDKQDVIDLTKISKMTNSEK